MPDKKKRRKKGEPRDKPIKLPDDFEGVLKALLITAPEPKPPKKKRAIKKPAPK